VPAAPYPTNAAYLTFQVQGQESSDNGNGRRAETIMGVGGGLRVDVHGQRFMDMDKGWWMVMVTIRGWWLSKSHCP
jgi:hypothetical protein